MRASVYRTVLEGIETGRRGVAQIRDEAARLGATVGREVAALPPKALKVLDDARTMRKAAPPPSPAARPSTPRSKPLPSASSKPKPAPADRTPGWKAELGAGVNGAVDAATLGLANRATAIVKSTIGDGRHESYQSHLAKEDARDRYEAEHHRGARVAGEVLGTVGSIALTGGVGGVAQGALRSAQLGARVLPVALRLAKPATRMVPLASKATGFGKAALMQRLGPQAAIGAGGSGASVAGQVVADGIAGRLTQPEDLASSAAGGFVGALATLHGGPVRGAAAEAATAHRVRSMLTGEPIQTEAVAGDAAISGLIGRFGHVVGEKWANNLPSAKNFKRPIDLISKGELGELMSRSLSRMRGLPVSDVGKGWRTSDGSLTFTDHRIGPNQIVESKFGNSHKKLSRNQEKARAELGDDYRVDHFISDDIGKASGGALALLFPDASPEERRRPGD